MKVVHYLNQFFAGLGAEENAGVAPTRIDGAVGPGRGLGLEVSYTVACGDDFFGEFEDEALATILHWLEDDRPDVLICGPAFGSGRYGYACGVIAREAARRGIPTVAAMHEDNPGVAAADGWAFIVPTTSTVVGMRASLPVVAALAERLGQGQGPGSPGESGYLPRHRRLNCRVASTGAERAVDFVLAKLQGDTRTEVDPPDVRVEPPPGLPDVSAATIALVTESGCVPIGNPDRLTSRRSFRWLRYPIDGVMAMGADAYQTVHGGYDVRAANGDPNRIVPLDALRTLESTRAFAHLHPFYYTTSGVDTSVANSARFGQEIGRELVESGVSGVILTGT